MVHRQPPTLYEQVDPNRSTVYEAAKVARLSMHHYETTDHSVRVRSLTHDCAC